MTPWLGCIADGLIDAWRCLNYERSRASAPGVALQSWYQGQMQRLRRWRRIGTRAHAVQLRAERACAPVGLVYPREDNGQCAPWHLPERFACIGPAELPSHPVIEPAFLAAGLTGQAQQAAAAQALGTLAARAPLPVYWQGLPLQGIAGPLLPPARVAVCLHLFYPELWPEIQRQLQWIPEPWDLLVSVPSFAATPAWHAILHDQPRVRFMPVANRGRDVAPFLVWLRSGALDGYDAVCKLHGKRSPHTPDGNAWRDALLNALVGSAANVANIVAQFRLDARLAMVGPANSHPTLGAAAGWNKNKSLVQLLSRRLALGAVTDADSFFAGTMFWLRPAAFQALRSCSLRNEDFAFEMAQTEGTLAHALERLLVLIAQRTGHRVLAWPPHAAIT